MTYLSDEDRQLLLTDPDAYVKAKHGQALAGLQATAAAAGTGVTPEAQAELRRRLCKYDPILFALIYFRRHLRPPINSKDDPIPPITLSRFHLDIAESAIGWAKSNIGLKESRTAWVAPRHSGKSTWAFTILPTWALAYGHRKFVAAFADNASMAEEHLATFKREVQTENQLLRQDFPRLCSAKRRPGGVTDSDRRNMYLSQSDAVFSAKGMDSTALGAKVGNQRPDLLLFDDIEPSEDQYSPGQKEGRLQTLREALFPMDLSAVVVFTGTVLMDGAIMHDIVRQEIESDATSPAWVRAENIVTHYYPALLPTEDGGEVSLWPAKWSTEFLQNERATNPRGYAMPFNNQPVPANSAYWTEDMFHYETLDGLTKHIISVDPAVTTKRSSDFTGIAVLSWSPHDQRIMIRHTEMVKLTPAELRRHILQLLVRFPYVRGVLVETNQGGDTWKGSVLHNMPVQVAEVKQTVKKELRWASVLDLWNARRVVHDPNGQTGPFERQAIAVPRSANDDVVDAVVSGVEHMVKHFSAKQAPARRKSRVVNYAA